MKNQQIQKKLTFNLRNALTGLSLLTILNFIQPVNPLTESGQLFYALMAVITAFAFPWLQVMEVSDASQDQTPKS